MKRPRARQLPWLRLASYSLISHERRDGGASPRRATKSGAAVQSGIQLVNQLRVDGAVALSGEELVASLNPFQILPAEYPRMLWAGIPVDKAGGGATAECRLAPHISRAV